MSTSVRKKSGSSGASTYLMVPIFIFFALLIFAVIRGPGLITSAGIGSAVIVVAPLVLATYALTIIVMAGRAGVDLSIGPLIGFINVSLIQLVGIGFMESPIAVFLFAMAVGVAYQILIGLIIIFVRVQPIIVSLSGYLALVGLNLMIMPRPGGLAPDWMLDWGAGTTIFSPVLVILIVATIGWYILAKTAFFGNLKMMGSDERATYTSGVNINMVRLGAHIIGGIYAGLAALTFTSLISSGDPSQGTTYTLMAVTALVLGGANLAGGRGSAFGSLLGALNIYLITYALSTFNFGQVQSYVTDMAYGAVLVVSLLISVAIPQLQKTARNLSPVMFFVILAVVALGVSMHAAMDKLVEPVTVKATQLATVAPAQAESASYPAGTYFLFVILGAAAVAYAVRTLIKHTTAPMVGFILVLIVAALGLIFNSGTPTDVVTAVATQTAAPAVADQTFGFFALETISGATDTLIKTDTMAQSTYVLIGVLGTVLLASLIILLMLPHVAMRTKRVAMVLFGGAVAVIAISALFFSDAEQGYLASQLSGEIYAIILVGALLFTITAPLVQTKLQNVNNLFIGALGALAIIVVYFFSNGNSVPADVIAQGIGYAEPVIRTGVVPAALPAVDYAEPARINVGVSTMAIFSELAYCGIIIVLLHIFLRMAMGETSFRSFWRYWHIAVLAALTWSCLFYAIGVPLWKILAVIGVAIITAPNVMHIISTYIVGEKRDSAISRWEG